MRRKNPITELAVRKLAKVPGKHAVGGVDGLYLRVVGDSVTWLFRAMVAGRRRDKSMGAAADMTLAQAREKAREYRRMLREGQDIIELDRARRADARAAVARRMTFAQCVTAYIEAHGSAWKNPKHRAQWQSTLDTYCAPVFGALDVASIDTPLVLKALEPIWTTRTETASRVRGRVESVLAWATVRGLRQGENPARWRGHLDALLPAPARLKRVEHHAALPYAEAPAFMPLLRAVAGTGARALEFAILTACRSGEVRGATWDEFDLDAGMWIIPANRMKAEKEHHVPLSPAAVDLLKTLPRDGDLVFPGSTPGKPLSDMTLTAVLRRMGRGDLTAHGFRSTFRDWAGETTAHPREVIEHALAHQLKDKAEAAYARGSLLEKRRVLMADWAGYLA